MPEDKTASTVKQNPFDYLIYGYNTAKVLGYDYIEASVSTVNDLAENELQQLAYLSESGDFSLKICNCFIPSSLQLFETPFSKIESFVKKSMKKMSFLGVDRVVFGSGKARMRPEEISESDGLDVICRFLDLCSHTGYEYNISTALEQLNSTETNVINTVSEAAKAINNFSESNLFLLIDVFHMAVENEDINNICKHIDSVSHFHVSEAPGRVYPGKYNSEYLRRFIKLLKNNKIDKDITVECVFNDFEKEAEISINYLKGLYYEI